MKKKAFFGVITILFLLSASFCFAEMGKGKCNMKKGMKCPMAQGMRMGGMMTKKVVATSDGGVVVMICNKLYKYDKDLNLIKEVELPMDMEHMKKMQMKMKEMKGK